MEKIVLDTDIIVDHLRSFPKAIAFFEKLDPETVLFSAITESELLAGKMNDLPEKREALLRLLRCFSKVSVGNPLALLAGDISRKYNCAIPDSIIAATAILNNATLMTRNLKDFKKIQGLMVIAPY